MQHLPFSDESPDRQLFLAHLRQQQFMFQHECGGFFPGSSMMPMGGGGMGMTMMPMNTMPHSHLQQQQQWQRLSASFPQHALKSSGPVGFYSEATAMSRKMILESASAMRMGMNRMEVAYAEDVVKPSATKALERTGTRCVSPGESSQNDDGNHSHSDSTPDSDSDSDCDIDAGSDCHSEARSESPALMNTLPAERVATETETESKKRQDEPKRKAGTKRASSEMATSMDETSSTADETSNAPSEFIFEIEQPKRRRSAYNLFFQHERARLLTLAENGKSLEYQPPQNLTVEKVRELLENNPHFTDRSKRRHRKSHGKVSFMGLVKTVSNSWKNVDKETKAVFEALAKEDQTRYQKEWKEYKLRCRKVKREALQQKKKAARAKEQKSAKRAKTSRVASKEERKVEAEENVLEALSVADSSDCSRAMAKEAACDTSMSLPQHDEIMLMISSKVSEQEMHSHDDGQLVDLALELDPDFAMGLDGIAMV